MNRRILFIQLSFILLAILFGIIGWITASTVMKWAAPAYGLAFVSMGLGLYSFFISSYTDKRMNEITTTLARIEELQEEILKQQKEQESSGSPVVASVQALSQFYFDYLAQQKEEKEKEQ